MNKTQLKKFKRIFEEQRGQIIGASRVVREDFSVNEDERYDEVDQASLDIEQGMRMRLCNRETLLIKKIEEALRRIEEGSFGECGECGEDIELRRLEARPIATLCIGCKEDQERREGLTTIGRSHKSLGEGFARRSTH